MDKLADGLQRLGEDDLLQVVQMVHDNKAPDSYTKNDVERMSFPPFSSTQHESELIVYSTIQRANSMSIFIHYPTPSSRCYGTLHRKRVLCN